MIDQAIVSRIRDAADIVQVVSEFVTLHKRGVNYVGLCPFHDEKTPSFSVSPSKGICYCFSCHKGGDVIHFLMLHEQMSYVEALRWLGKKYGIEVPEKEQTPEEREAQSNRESLFVVNSFARDYFQHNLYDTPEGQIGLAYFRSRGFRDDIIKKFQLGYSMNAHDALAKEALKKGYKKDFLIQTGLCYETNEHQLHDRFWGRVMFPVLSLSGKIVAFGGRVMNTTNKNLAKYVNSIESDIYKKRNELYGIYFARQAITKEDCCYLVEGYTDVISMHQSGIENVVSSSGTALTEEQIRLIRRFTNHITVLYDGDMAGIKASIRGIDMLLAAGMTIKVLLLPDNDDPDSFARKHNATEYQAYIKEHQVDFIRFKTNILLADAGEDPIKRAELVKNIVHSISVIPEAIVRDVYIQECSEQLHVSDKLLVTQVAKERSRIREDKQKEKEREAERLERQKNGEEVPPEPAAEEKEQTPAEKITAEEITNFLPQNKKEGREFYPYERMILQVILRYGEKTMCIAKDNDGKEIPLTVIEYVANDLKRDDLSFYNPLHKQIFEEAQRHVHDKDFKSQDYFMSYPDPQITDLCFKLITSPYQLSKIYTNMKVDDESRLLELVPTLMTNFKYAIVTEEIKSVVAQLKDPAITSDSAKCNAVMQRFSELHQIQNIMAQKLGERVIIP